MMKKRLCGLMALLLCMVVLSASANCVEENCPFEDHNGLNEYLQVIDNGKPVQQLGYNELFFPVHTTQLQMMTSGNQLTIEYYDENGLPVGETVEWEEGKVFAARPLPAGQAWWVRRACTNVNTSNYKSRAELQAVTQTYRSNPLLTGIEGVPNASYVIAAFKDLPSVFTNYNSNSSQAGDARLDRELSELARQFMTQEMAKALPGYEGIDFHGVAVYMLLTSKSGEDAMAPVSPSDQEQMMKYFGPQTITFPYPAGYSRANARPEDFAVLHAVADSYTAPVNLTCISHPVTLTDQGIQITVTSLSPFAVGYRKPIPLPSAPVPTTGDNTPIALYAALCLLSLAAAAVVMKRKKA